ncbi:hypothetical protein BHE97_02375 [Aeromicrobium sp. PE09-221]|uniref:DUF6049 family protein n=1 Tax=Aeromicrobium sp. PE09-221 TaxID=1898043 RepID=UPI000B3EC83C|nr:DUF6049 family protein [Aeromicrobium sp. PE09-221]OUZ12562.1 hypothetical protein BHE97_02375 [Aeromicrobium sp. PE09-221]
MSFRPAGRRRALVAAIVGWLVVGLTVLLPAPSHAAEDEEAGGGLTVTIDALTPSQLTADATIEVSGRIENTSDGDWTSVQAYLVMARSPFTTREQVETAARSSTTYTGERVTTIGLFDEVGDISPGDTAQYDLSVPLHEIGPTGAPGVYPVGVQLLATDPDGVRPQDSVARATTFLPWIDDPSSPIGGGLVWSFVLDPRRDDEADDVQAMRTAIGENGRLRRQLDLAAALPVEAQSLIIDPAVLDASQQMADGESPFDDVTEEAREEAQSFHDDLVALARRSSVWNIDYDRPDWAALSERPDLAAAFSPRVAATTQSVLDEHGITGRSARWAMETGVTGGMLEHHRAEGDAPTIVRAAALPQWDQRDGSLVTVDAEHGPALLAVDDTLGSGEEVETTVSLRQRVLTRAALAALSRAADPESAADAVTFVDPGWVPEPRADTGALAAALRGDDLVEGTTLDRLVTGGVDPYDGEVPAHPVSEPLPSSVLAAAANLAEAEDAVAAVSTGEAGGSQAERNLASAVSVRWRSAPERAVRSAEQQAIERSGSLAGIEVLGPQTVTLSSSQGSFPLTVNNPTRLPISVSILLTPGNPALSSSRLDPIDVAPGERRTVNAEIDLGRQTSTTITAQAMAGDRAIGSETSFNVRSSQVGTIVWVAMGVAVAGVVFAMSRRFRRRGFRRLSESEDHG